jgi:hypothetical protein
VQLAVWICERVGPWNLQEELVCVCFVSVLCEPGPRLLAASPGSLWFRCPGLRRLEQSAAPGLI